MDKKMQMISRVRGIMQEQGIKQTQLAALIGIKQGSMSEFLSGQILRPRFLPELADALGTSVEFLVNGDDTPKRKPVAGVPPLPGHESSLFMAACPQRTAPYTGWPSRTAKA